MSHPTTATRRRPAAPEPAPSPSAVAVALLFATAPLDGEQPLGVQRWEGTTLTARLAEQMRSVGAAEVVVVVRPGGAAHLGDLPAAVRESPDVAADLRLVAEVAREAAGAVAIAYGDIVTQREALAGALADPRIGTGVLVTRRPLKGVPVRTDRDRVVSAGSPFHRVQRPNLTALGVIKVAAGDLEALAGVAERLAELTAGDLPEAWARRLANRSTVPDAAGEPAVRRRRRVDAMREDVVSLLLVGLVRSGVVVMVAKLRRLFWARPLTDETLGRARARIDEFDEDAALLASAVKSQDGFFTTFFVSPYSKHIARWCAHRGFTPNQVTVASMVVGTAAAALFATGERPGLVAGAVLLQAAFTLDCVDGQLARYTRTFTSLGAWLDSVLDRAKEYVVFAGLAIGASASGDDVWLLAGAALAFQTARHMLDFSIAAARHEARSIAVAQLPLEQPADYVIRDRPEAPRKPRPEPADEAPEDEPDDDDGPEGDEEPAEPRAQALWKWAKRIAGFPIGERFAAISLTAAIWDARVTFVVLLAWGLVGIAYNVAGRIAR